MTTRSTTFVPRQVFLFSGHMMDAPDRKTPRFPPQMENAAAARIAQALDEFGAAASDLALCEAAAGGDLLFLEACRQRKVRCEVLLPFDEQTFIERSILPASNGTRWRERFSAAKAALAEPPHIMDEELGPTLQGVDPFERCNVWLLESALAWGDEKLRFICLWNGAGGDGPGGTKHMIDEVRRHDGRVKWIDTREL